MDVNAADRERSTPLHAASYKGHIEVVKALLAVDGVDVNAASSMRITPLHVASLRGHLAVVHALLAADGVDVNAYELVSGCTPLGTSIRMGRKKVEAVLRAFGAA